MGISVGTVRELLCFFFSFKGLVLLLFFYGAALSGRAPQAPELFPPVCSVYSFASNVQTFASRFGIPEPIVSSPEKRTEVTCAWSLPAAAESFLHIKFCSLYSEFDAGRAGNRADSNCVSKLSPKCRPGHSLPSIFTTQFDASQISRSEVNRSKSQHNYIIKI